MLHKLVQLDGCDVLVMQDQMDVTCGIIMQTKLQKLMKTKFLLEDQAGYHQQQLKAHIPVSFARRSLLVTGSASSVILQQPC
ncbi:hypothetical protein PHMEG_0001591 [Phytophthora megakarya]|uniref:Uncharacterized protein n=1 Tax=Phytophthora megakarya TaxID=4795 RepID=A0A225X073_9STRA|nr:hypothetical protein PHMEG_0001591 [Phytophthora megakarya]